MSNQEQRCICGHINQNVDNLKLPTPHLDKIVAILENPRLPHADKPRVQEALQRAVSRVDHET